MTISSLVIIDAILVSDLVVIPGQASLPDVKAAVQVLKRVRSRSKILGRDIEARVLLTFTEAGPIEANISKDKGVQPNERALLRNIRATWPGSPLSSSWAKTAYAAKAIHLDEAYSVARSGWR